MNPTKLDIGRPAASISRRLDRALWLGERVTHMPAGLADSAPGPREARGA